MNVIEDIVHEDLAAQIPPDEARAITEHMWADGVQGSSVLLGGEQGQAPDIDMECLLPETSARLDPTTSGGFSVFSGPSHIGAVTGTSRAFPCAEKNVSLDF